MRKISTWRLRWCACGYSILFFRFFIEPPQPFRHGLIILFLRAVNNRLGRGCYVYDYKCHKQDEQH